LVPPLIPPRSKHCAVKYHWFRACLEPEILEFEGGTKVIISRYIYKRFAEEQN